MQNRRSSCSDCNIKPHIDCGALHIDCNFILRSHRPFERNEVFKKDLKQLGKDLEKALYIHLDRSTAIDNIDNTQF